MTPASLPALGVRWAARLTSLGVIGAATVALVRGDWPNPGADTGLAPLASFFLMSACAGLLLAWVLEGSGGLVAIFGVAALYLISLAATGRLPPGWLLSVAAVNGFLFLLSRALHAALAQEAASDGEGAL